MPAEHPARPTLRRRGSCALITAIGCVLALVTGCLKTNPAPAHAQRDPDQALKDHYGAWISVETATTPTPIQGELLAVGGTTLYVLDGGEVTEVELASVKKATLSAYEASGAGAVTLTVIGAASTLSHGFFLIFTLPIWLGVGVATSRHQSGLGYAGYKRGDGLKDLEAFNRWARFPQGLPEGYGKNSTRPCAGASCVTPRDRGGADQPCFPNLTCYQGLRCNAEQRCTPEPAPGKAGGRCFSTGACDPGLRCQDGRCEPPPAPTEDAPPAPAGGDATPPTPTATPQLAPPPARPTPTAEPRP